MLSEESTARFPPETFIEGHEARHQCQDQTCEIAGVGSCNARPGIEMRTQLARTSRSRPGEAGGSPRDTTSEAQ